MPILNNIISDAEKNLIIVKICKKTPGEIHEYAFPAEITPAEITAQLYVDMDLIEYDIFVNKKVKNYNHKIIKNSELIFAPKNGNKQSIITGEILEASFAASKKIAIPSNFTPHKALKNFFGNISFKNYRINVNGRNIDSSQLKNFSLNADFFISLFELN